MQSSTGYVRGLVREAGERYYRRSLSEQAARKLAELDGDEPESAPPLLEFIPKTSPHLRAPTWLKPLVDVVERAAVDPIRVVTNVPPQHGKSETLLHALARQVKYQPKRTNAYTSFATEFSRSQSRKCRNYALEAGVTIDPGANRLEEWRTMEGGGVLATGRGGPLTGYKVDGILVVDDILKDREEAESVTIRNKCWDWFWDVAMTRVHPSASVIVNMTRWHTDDLAGRLIERGWEVVKLPAIKPDGTPLWDERTLEFFEPYRKNEYTWASLYMQEPRPRGSEVFGQPVTCLLDEVPTQGQFAIGVDLAYTAKTHSDYSVSLAMVKAGDVYYVADIQRKQVQVTDFTMTLRAHASRYPGSPMTWHCSGTEQGSAQFIKQAGVPLNAVATTTDKFVRAQDVSAAWNAGKVIVPRDAAWSNAFIDEVCAFTGVGDLHDDQVDALASAFGALKQSSQVVRYSSVRKRTTAGWGSHY